MSLVINNNLMAYGATNSLNMHYGNMAKSVQRLSSGLRINGASDDAAGLAIREIMRANIATIQQGIRNANDAISMIQTADGALGVIDEKLIRMKELAEQASTGTYDEIQRGMIDDEYQAMASEVTRIANATDFNDIKLLDGTLSGVHDGRSIDSTGSIKIHFGVGNDSAEDYYFIDIADTTASALGVGMETNTWNAEELGDLRNNIAAATATTPAAGQVDDERFDHLPPGYRELAISLNDLMTNAGAAVNPPDNDIFHPAPAAITPVQLQDAYNAYALDREDRGLDPHTTAEFAELIGEEFNLTVATDLVVGVAGTLDINVDVEGRFVAGPALDDPAGAPLGQGMVDLQAETLAAAARFTPGNNIRTQERAQDALRALDEAIVVKDKARAGMGAVQNRLENTVANLTIQRQNLQASESRISDIDVASEMTNFVRNQTLSQTANAMLSQANSLPQMALQLVQG